MKRDTNFYDSFSGEEIEVASILLELSSIPVRRFPSLWGMKKERSVRKRIQESPAARYGRSVYASTDAYSSRAAEKAEACGSPNTPLLFPSIESDENLKFLNNKNAGKRKREEFAEKIGRLTRLRDLLRKELENVRQYYSKQETLNLQLKSLRQHLLISGGVHRQTPPVNCRIVPGDVHVDQNNQHQPSRNHDPRQPLIFHRTATGAGSSRSSSSCLYSGVELDGTHYAVVDSREPLDQIRVAAIARRRRKRDLQVQKLPTRLLGSK